MRTVFIKKEKKNMREKTGAPSKTAGAQNEAIDNSEAPALEQERESDLEARKKMLSEEKEKLMTVYPDFDLKTEMEQPLFVKLVRAGVAMRDAYEFVHRDELTSAMIEEIAQKLYARSLGEKETKTRRPAENGTSGRAAARLREKAPSEWSKEERERIGREALRGKKHSIDI